MTFTEALALNAKSPRFCVVLHNQKLNDYAVWNKDAPLSEIAREWANATGGIVTVNQAFTDCMFPIPAYGEDGFFYPTN